MRSTIRDTLLARLSADTMSAMPWKEFDELYKEKIWSVVRAVGVNHNECADVWQEILSAMREGAFENFDRDKNRSGRFYTFLVKIAKNCAISALRRRTYRTANQTLPELSEDQDSFADKIADDEPSPDIRAEMQGEIQNVRRFLTAFVEYALFEQRTIDCVWEQIESDAYGWPSKPEIALKYEYTTALDQKIPNSMYEARSSLTRDLRLALKFTTESRHRISADYTEESSIKDAVAFVKQARSTKRR